MSQPCHSDLRPRNTEKIPGTDGDAVPLKWKKFFRGIGVAGRKSNPGQSSV
jgi:hypothetical protein